MNVTSDKFMSLPLWLYIVGWILFLGLFVSLINFTPASINNPVVAGMYLIDFCVHEVSHILTSAFPPIITAAAGSIGEVSFTILLFIAVFRSKSYFAVVFAGLWVMLGLMSFGAYVADAKAQAIPLISMSETAKHDWNYVLTQLGWLDWCTQIGNTIRTIGITVGVASLLFGVYLMYREAAINRTMRSTTKNATV